jgi:glyoxylase-like metal-dependent hydrolase (beta-lactamase superfamily II)
MQFLNLEELSKGVMIMRLQQFTLGDLAVNTYLLWDEETLEAICIDPGAPVGEIIKVIKEENLKLNHILLTHGHCDHFLGVSELQAATRALVLIHSADAAMLSNPTLNLSSFFGKELAIKADTLLEDGDVLCLGSKMLRIIHTPGHTPGGIFLVGPGLIFTGDTIFAGSIGRTDFPGGDQKVLARSLTTLLQFSDETRLFPGHGMKTILGREKYFNPFLKNKVED